MSLPDRVMVYERDCFSYALSVLDKSIATVIGHTQPGTGVILCQCEMIESYSASPQTFPFITENHTSITLVCLPSMSCVSKWAFPVATMTTSAILVKSERSGVFELQLVTVAHWDIQSWMRGFPTILLFQIITTCFPGRGTSYSCMSFITPAGVHGVNQLGSASMTLPWFSGWNQSTSFKGLICFITSDSSMCSGRGSCTIYHVIISSLLSFSSSCMSSFWEIFFSNWKRENHIPIFLHSLLFCLMYLILGESSPHTKTAPRVISSGICFIECDSWSYMDAASFFPSSIIEQRGYGEDIFLRGTDERSLAGNSGIANFSLGYILTI